MKFARSSARTIPIESVIHAVRGERVILDADLARIYGVSTKRLNEQVKRNARRFPGDFAFRLSKAELAQLLRQLEGSEQFSNRSQIATGPQKHRDPRFLPYAGGRREIRWKMSIGHRDRSEIWGISRKDAKHALSAVEGGAKE
jgi:hypothetical protein